MRQLEHVPPDRYGVMLQNLMDCGFEPRLAELVAAAKIDRQERHEADEREWRMEVGGSRPTSAASAILSWTGSSVILDWSTELGPMLDGMLRRQRREVVHIGISGDDATPPATGFNVLAWIDTTHLRAEQQVRTVVSWIYDESAAGAVPGKDAFIAAMGRELVTCLLAHLVWSDPQAIEISLTTLAEGISVPEDDMLSLLAGIRASSNSQMARGIAGMLMGKADKTFTGIYFNAFIATEWLLIGACADLVSGGGFDPRMLLAGETTVFLNVGGRTLETTPAIARVLVGALLNVLYMADRRTHGRVLFLLDERARLGRLPAVKTARVLGRQYGVLLHTLW